jgi:hypothetical protein
MKKIILLTAVFAFSFQVKSQTAIQEFNFNGTLSNSAKTISFTGESKYVKDRTGNANGAIRVTNNFLEATIANLPLSNSQRTVSVWVKYNDVACANYVWGYGSLINAQYFGLLQQSTTNSKSDLNLACWGPSNDLIVTTTIAAETWYNYTVTYDGLCSKIYRNGELLKSSVSARKLTSSIVFGIGRMGSAVSINADIDDLKIYDVALTAEEIASIYNNEPILAPNDVVVANKTVKGTSKTASKSVTKTVVPVVAKKSTIVLSTPKETMNDKITEIYSTKGLKVLTGEKNEIDVTTLPEGTYLLKVSNSPNSSTEQKLTVK